MTVRADVIVIGAGIAGAAAAAELATLASVILLEMEAQPGYHATGRSAAFFVPSYGNAAIRAVTAICEPFYRSPPDGFSEVQLIKPRGCLFFGREDQREALSALHNEVPFLQELSAEEIRQRVPIILAEYVDSGLLDETGGDLDVDAILQGFLRRLRTSGSELYTHHEVQELSRTNGVWRVVTKDETFEAPVVVNAAGAWVDEIATLAGLEPLELQPKRRTAMLIDAPENIDITDWPLMIDVEEQFYFKPDAGALLLSPADETPSPACDAQAEELDIAVAVDRFETATGLEVLRINHRWAGLRTFAPDKTFIVGFDPREDSFFWLAGQGGYGVQTAPGLAQLTASLITGTPLPANMHIDAGLIDQLAPARLIP